MNWIGKEKKKNIPPEKKVQRAKIILVILAFVFLFVLIKPTGKSSTTNGDDDIVAVMDIALDSLLQSLGYEDYDVYYKGPIETLYQQLDCPEEDEIIRLEMRRSLIEANPGMTDKEKIAEIEKIMLTIEQLQQQVNRFYENDKTRMEYHSRRIRFATPNGRKYTFFEQMMAGYFRTNYFLDITESADNADKQLEKFKKQE